MSKYFTEVKFEVSENPGTPKRPATVIKVNKDKFEKVAEIIELEFTKIKSGESKFVPYAIDNKNFASPFGNRFKMLKTDTTAANIKAFLELAKQDLGAAAATYFQGLLKTTLEEVPND